MRDWIGTKPMQLLKNRCRVMMPAGTCKDTSDSILDKF